MFIPSLPVVTVGNLLKDPADWRSHLPPGRLISFSRGRHALGGAVERLSSPEAPVLLPSFVCDSAVEPFRRSGRAIEFYGVDSSLRVDPEELASRATPGSCVVLVHFYGIPDPALDRQVTAVAAAGAVLVEDCAHALYGRLGARPLGSFGAAAVFSPRKSLPTPDGGLLVMEGEGDQVTLRRTRATEILRLGIYSMERSVGFSPRTRLLASATVRRRLTAIDDQTAEAPAFDLPRLTYEVLRRADGRAIAQRRLENYRNLARMVAAELPDLEQPYPEIPAGSAPLMLPLRIPRRRDAFAATLYGRDISVRAMWDVLPTEIPLDQFPDSQILRDQILCLPVQQDLRERDLNRMVAIMKQEWRRL